MFMSSGAYPPYICRIERIVDKIILTELYLLGLTGRTAREYDYGRLRAVARKAEFRKAGGHIQRRTAPFVVKHPVFEQKFAVLGTFARVIHHALRADKLQSEETEHGIYRARGNDRDGRPFGHSRPPELRGEIGGRPKSLSDGIACTSVKDKDVVGALRRKSTEIFVYGCIVRLHSYLLLKLKVSKSADVGIGE